MHPGTRYLSPVVEAAAAELLDITGLKDGKCVFPSSGSEAVEFAVQVARRLSEKPRWLTSARSYLGAYGSAGKKNNTEAWLLDWEKCQGGRPEEYFSQIPYERVGAFVFEPGGSGISFVKFPLKELVQQLCSKVRQAGALLLSTKSQRESDEQESGSGSSTNDLQPDIVSMGKGLGNGYPVSAVVIRKELAEALEATGFYYAQSQQNDPLGAAIAWEVISTIRERVWIEKGHEKGECFLAGLKQLERECELVKEARGRGLLLGLELWPDESKSVKDIYKALLDRGFLVGYYAAGNLLRFDPALTVEREDIADLLEVLPKILG